MSDKFSSYAAKVLKWTWRNGSRLFYYLMDEIEQRRPQLEEERERRREEKLRMRQQIEEFERKYTKMNKTVLIDKFKELYKIKRETPDFEFSLEERVLMKIARKRMSEDKR